MLNLLAVEFAETDAPAGVVTLTFSGGKALRLEVECLEAELADLGPSWAAGRCPAHAVIEGETARSQSRAPLRCRPPRRPRKDFGSELGPRPRAHALA